MIDNQLNFQDRINYVKSKVARRIGALYRSKKLLPLKYRHMFVNALMLPQFERKIIIINVRNIESTAKFSQCIKSSFMLDAINGVSSYAINNCNSFDYFYTTAL